jgi:hypothetical protein
MSRFFCTFPLSWSFLYISSSLPPPTSFRLHFRALLPYICAHIRAFSRPYRRLLCRAMAYLGKSPNLQISKSPNYHYPAHLLLLLLLLLRLLQRRLLLLSPSLSTPHALAHMQIGVAHTHTHTPTHTHTHTHHADSDSTQGEEMHDKMHLSEEHLGP